MSITVGQLVNLKGTHYRVASITQTKSTKLALMGKEDYVQTYIRPSTRIVANQPQVEDFKEGDVLSEETELVLLTEFPRVVNGPAYREIISKWVVEVVRKLGEGEEKEGEESCTEKT